MTVAVAEGQNVSRNDNPSRLPKRNRKIKEKMFREIVPYTFFQGIVHFDGGERILQRDTITPPEPVGNTGYGESICRNEGVVIRHFC